MARFSDIIGQEQLKNHVQNALRTGHISHACLITGEEGMGKRMFARTFAQALLCENRQEGQIEPCGSCPSCEMAQADTHPDLCTLTHEKDSYGVDEIRTQLVNNVILKPMRSERRIFIIPEADRMNNPSQNVLLKTLEEPPPYVVILLLTERPDALLQTILSRTVELPLRPVQDGEIMRFLMREHRIPDYRAHECAVFAEGNVGRAIRYSSDDRYRTQVERTAVLLKEIDHLSTAAIMERLLQILMPEDAQEETGRKKKRSLKEADRRELDHFLDLLMILNRDAMVYKALGSSEKLVFAEQEAYDRVAAGHSWQLLYGNMRRIGEARDRLSFHVNRDMTMELLMLGFKESKPAKAG